MAGPTVRSSAIGTRRLRFCFTGAADGDFSIDAPAAGLEERRAAVVDAPWTWLRQVHGADVVRVAAPGGEAGAYADGAVTLADNTPLSVQTADCGPVLFACETTDGAGAIGVAHAGWKGLEAGVLARTTEALRSLGATSVRAFLGPCIGASCYEFGVADLERLAAQFGPGVIARTRAGSPALELRAGIERALCDLDVAYDDRYWRCTSCAGDGFSHRARRDRQRHALVAWIEPFAAPGQRAR